MKKSGIRFHAHDLTEPLWKIEEHLDFVVHMAGIASPHHYKSRPLDTIDIAINWTRSTIEIARNHGARFLFFSSSEIYQTAKTIPTPETYIGSIASDNDRSCYDVSKLMGETITHVYGSTYELDVGIIRVFNSFGPGLSANDYRILPKIASALYTNTELNVFAGTQSISFELRWSMGQKYENFCHIIYENGDIFFDRFFSKPNNFNSSTIFSFRNKSYTKK